MNVPVMVWIICKKYYFNWYKKKLHTNISHLEFRCERSNLQYITLEFKVKENHLKFMWNDAPVGECGVICGFYYLLKLLIGNACRVCMLCYLRRPIWVYSRKNYNSKFKTLNFLTICHLTNCSLFAKFQGNRPSGSF